MPDPPGTFASIHRRYDIRRSADGRRGPLQCRQPSKARPPLSHPATEVSTPTIPAPGLSEATWMSTPLPDTPLVLTRPCEVRHPSPTRRVLSGGAVSSAASTSQPPPLFLRDHMIRDTHHCSVPTFSPGHTSRDTQREVAWSFLGGRHNPDTQTFGASTFLTRPTFHRHP